MAPHVFRSAIVLTGATASGKSELAVELGLRIGAEIISMDSMAVYRGMDIGTAKPSREARQRVPHHLIDVLDPWESGNVAWWLDEAVHACRAIQSRGRRVLLAGGTPLYLKAILFGLFDGPPADVRIRQRLKLEAECRGSAALHNRLRELDPAAASRLHPQDTRRIIRALEVFELTGRPISSWQQQWPTSAATVGPATGDHARAPTVWWLDVPRPQLYDRINARVRHMVDAGLVEEARALQRMPRPLSPQAAQALGYKEVFAYLAGHTTLEDAISLIQRRTRQFAKRQLTWFRRLPNCIPITGQLTTGRADWTMV